MYAVIENIIVKERIRKELVHIPELAADIEKNGLLHPITVMEVNGGELRLLAGLRRIKAAQALGWVEIEVKVVAPADAEAALNIEISENEQREQFTYSEKMDYARIIEEIEKAKALERKSAGGKGGLNEDVDCGPHLEQGRSRDAIGAKIGMSGRQYDRAKYIADKATSDVIEQLDNGERTIRGTYDELRAKDNAMLPNCEDIADDEPMHETPRQVGNDIWLQSEKVAENLALLSKSHADDPFYQRLEAEAAEAARKREEYDSLTPEGKIEVLQHQIKELRSKEAEMQSDIDNLRERFKISVDHKDSIIEFLKQQNAKLTEALEAANARIAELESQE